MDENVPPINMPPPPPLPLPPPPPQGPPPVIIQPTPAAPRRSRGWMVFALILLGLLFISVLFNLGNLASSMMRGKGGHYAGRTAGPRLEETVLEDNDAVNKIAVLEVAGIITSQAVGQGGGYNIVEVIRAQLKRAEEDRQVKAVVLKVDSPGGEVLASDEINRELRRFQDKSGKPVVASMGNLAASGGYYVSAPCRWIVANDMTITGSIGVIMSTYNYRHLMDKVGVMPQTFKSGKFKDMLSGSKEPDEITQQEKDMVQALINETYEKFKGVVQNGRDKAHDQNKTASDPKDKGQPLSANWQEYADGRVLSGSEARNLGFVDELGNFQDAVKRAKRLAGMISDANLIEYQQRYDLSDIFRLFGRSETKSIKVDLGMDLPRLQAGRLYFLSPTFLH
jgi:protease-4